MRRYFHFHSWRFRGNSVGGNSAPPPSNNGNENNEKACIWGLLIVVAIILVVVLICNLIETHYKKHEHIYSDYGTSTTTCKELGETTYWCIYHNSDYYECNKKKVVKDTKYKDCRYKVIETLSEKLEENKYLSKCYWCGKEIIETVKNTYGSYGTAKIRDGSGWVEGYIDDNRNGEFSCLIYAGTTKAGELDKMKLNAVLLVFDKDGNKIYEEEKAFRFMSNGLRFVEFNVNSSYIDKYYTHRWDLRSQ